MHYFHIDGFAKLVFHRGISHCTRHHNLFVGAHTKSRNSLVPTPKKYLEICLHTILYMTPIGSNSDRLYLALKMEMFFAEIFV